MSNNNEFKVSSAASLHKGNTPSFPLIRTIAICLVLLAITLSSGIPNIQHASEPTTSGTECGLEDSHQEHTTSQSIVLNDDDLSWRKINAAVVLPSEFFKDPLTAQLSGKSEFQLKAEALTAIAMANRHLSSLRIRIEVAKFEVFSDESQDPFKRAADNSNPYDMLQTAVSRRRANPNSEHDLTIVLGKKYYAGKFGLANAASSCVNFERSVVFATQGGIGAAQEYKLGHTIAHEVGHYLGMSHTTGDLFAPKDLMSSLSSLHPLGFSDESIAQALNHSGAELPGGSCFEPDEENNQPGDSDGDGVDDEMELLDGSDYLDAGSYATKVVSPNFALWNSFLGLVNILELSNVGEQVSTIDLILRAANGEAIEIFSTELDPGEQFDLILNLLQNFPINSYGTLEIRFNGRIDGRMSYYKPGATSENEFAYSLPLSNPIKGKSVVSYNTYQPSLAAEDSNNQVYQWLTIVNLEPVTTHFRVTSFDSESKVLRSKAFSVAANSRVDLDGGHLFAGINKTGTHLILPEDPKQAYIASSLRLGASSKSGESFDFASPLEARRGNGQTVSIPISAYDSDSSSEDAWLEISNSLGRATNALLQLFDSEGALIHQQNLSLGAFANYHFNSSSILRSLGVAFGSASISPEEPEALVVNMMCYFREKQTQGISSVFSSSAREAFRDNLHGSFNLFLNATNQLVTLNPYNFPVEIEVTKRLAASNEPIIHLIPAMSSLQLAIGPDKDIPADQDTYGSLQVRTSNGLPVIAEVRRLRESPKGVTLAIPTLMR